jgi:hypothetical protein
MDQNRIQCILSDRCNDHVDLDPFLKIANKLYFKAVLMAILNMPGRITLFLIKEIVVPRDYFDPVILKN